MRYPKGYPHFHYYYLKVEDWFFSMEILYSLRYNDYK
jgi:hypothetical protein